MLRATQPARLTRALPTPTLRPPTLMRRRRTLMLLLRMLTSPLPMRVSRRAPPTSRIRWAPLMRRCLPAASVQRSREVGPIICAATPGSVRPMVRTASSIAWCRHRKGVRIHPDVSDEQQSKPRIFAAKSSEQPKLFHRPAEDAGLHQQRPSGGSGLTWSGGSSLYNLKQEAQNRQRGAQQGQRFSQYQHSTGAGGSGSPRSFGGRR